MYGDNRDNAIPVILVNGAQQTIATWRTLVRHFEEDFKIVTFDFPGQGGSKILSGDDHVMLLEQSEVLRMVIEETTSMPTINIITSSWGGAVAAHYASTHPDRVDKLILGSFGLSANENLEATINEGKEAIRMGHKRRLGQIIIDKFGSGLPDRIKRQILNQFENIKEENTRQFYEHINWSLDAELEDLINFESIEADTLLINGTLDTIVDISSLDKLLEVIAKCRQLVIGNVGHFLHFEDSRILNDYRSFLEAH